MIKLEIWLSKCVLCFFFDNWINSTTTAFFYWILLCNVVFKSKHFFTSPLPHPVLFKAPKIHKSNWSDAVFLSCQQMTNLWVKVISLRKQNVFPLMLYRLGVCRLIYVWTVGKPTFIARSNCSVEIDENLNDHPFQPLTTFSQVLENIVVGSVCIYPCVCMSLWCVFSSWMAGKLGRGSAGVIVGTAEKQISFCCVWGAYSPLGW